MSIRSPHSFVVVAVRDVSGKTVEWAAEWVDPRAMKCAGVDPSVLKVGDKLRIVGSPGRDPAISKILVESITRTSDGWTAKGLVDTWNDWANRDKCSEPMPASAAFGG